MSLTLINIFCLRGNRQTTARGNTVSLSAITSKSFAPKEIRFVASLNVGQHVIRLRKCCNFEIAKPSRLRQLKPQRRKQITLLTRLKVIGLYQKNGIAGPKLDQHTKFLLASYLKMKLYNKFIVACMFPALLAGTAALATAQSECPCTKQANMAKVHNVTQATTVAYVTVQSGTAGGSDIVDTAVAAGKFNTLVAAVKAAGLVETLKGDGPFTVFAPSDAAFAKIPEEKLKELLKPENKKMLQSILTYHVVPGKVLAKDVVGLTEAKTANGQTLDIKVTDGKVLVDGANVVATDVVCKNGVIHIIDAVIMPKADIVDTAVSAGKFNTLVAAVKAAGLVETLKGKGPFTVFAPTDDAFSKVDAAVIQDLLKPENKEKLQSILTYHVVSGRVLAEDVVKLTSAKTVNGQELKVAVADGKVMVDGANVVATDIKCGNGVIHIIDTVIMPN